MKTLIAGFGSIGRRHLRNLRALGETDFVLLRSHNSTLPDDEIADLPVETTIEAALAHRPDAVVISNPTALHLDTAIPAARAGCHIFLEKPISHDLKRVDELTRAVKDGGGKVVVGFQLRFHPGLMKVKEMLDVEAIGKVFSFQAHWGEYLPGWHPWEDYRQGYAARGDLGGGVVLTLCHPFDYLRWLLGEVESLMGVTGRSGALELEVEDTADAILKMNAGMQGSLHLDYLQRPADHHLTILGSEGTITWRNDDGAVRLFKAASGTWEEFKAPENFDRNDMFLAEMSNLLEVIKYQAQPFCSLEDGIKALKLALAVHISARNKQPESDPAR
ncbi:MAG: Gfo/Idh/MocA family protein [Anaerolineaceae bacterium]